MVRRLLLRIGAGLATGALATAGLLAVLLMGAVAKVPFLPFTVFEWVIRVLPGRMVLFGLDTTLAALSGLGFNIKDTAKTAEQVLAIISMFGAGLLVGLLFFLTVRTTDRARTRMYALAVGGVFGVFSAVVAVVESTHSGVAAKIGLVVWTLVLFLLWGWAIAWLHARVFPGVYQRPVAEVERPEALPGTSPAATVAASEVVPEVVPEAAVPNAVVREAEAHAISRRRFLIQMGGLVATIVVAGAGVGAVLRAQIESAPATPGSAPIPFPNAGSPVQPAPGTRLEYTPVADHYRTDIVLTYPEIDPSKWRLAIKGLVANDLSLTLDEIKLRYKSRDQFVTISCISNVLGGPLIGTTLWTGVPFRDVLGDAGPTAEARYVHMTGFDGFDEEVDLQHVNSDPRILLVYAWNGKPLPGEHGFPLRAYIPDVYGMKQPKWLTDIELTPESRKGYWVQAGWDEKAEVNTTCVIDTVATKSLVTRDGQTYIPVGGIAYSGAKGISRVEIQIDDAPWTAAQLRQPLSELTWVIWRYDWLFSPGDHRLKVRAYDGQGRLQETADHEVFPAGATGIYSETRTIEPASP
jgi:DMSO/TMAO reductase YedYZ molybdopterin-dependent catalytic subunit